MRFFSEPQQPLGLLGALTLLASVSPVLAAPSSSSDNDYVGIFVILLVLIAFSGCLFQCVNSGSCYQDPAFADHGESAHGGEMLDVLHDVEAPVVHPEVETSGNTMHIVELRYKP